MWDRKLRAATQLVCRECLCRGLLSHVELIIDEYLGSFVNPSAFNSACEHGSSISSLEFLLSRTAPDWEKAACSAARGGHLEVLRWMMSGRLDGRGAWKSDFGNALRCAAAHGHLETAKWLHEREVACDISERPGGATENSEQESTYNVRSVLFDAARNGHLEVVQWLHSVRPDMSGWPIHTATGNGHLAIAQWLHYATSYTCSGLALDEAAENGHLSVLQWWYSHGKLKCTENAMCRAAGNGHLAVMKWLHVNGMQGRKPVNLQQVAENGHVEVLQWLFENEYSGLKDMNCCPTAAARNGHFTVLKWLRKLSARGFTKTTMDVAAANGHLDVVTWLHEHCRVGCTERAVHDAARNGHVKILQWFHKNYGGKWFDREMMDEAAEMGQLEVVRWLNENRSEGCTDDVLYNSARNDHLDVVRYLFEHTTAGYRFDTLVFPKGLEVVLANNPEVKMDSARLYISGMVAKHGHNFVKARLQTIANGTLFEGSRSTAILDWLDQFKLKQDNLREFSLCEDLRMKTMSDAVMHGNVERVQWFHRHGFDVCNSSMVELAILAGHTALVVWFQEQGCEFDVPKCIALAVQSKKVPLTRWIVETGREVGVDTATVLARDYHYVDIASSLSEVDRLKIILDKLSTSDRELVRQALTRAEQDDTGIAVRNAIRDATDRYEWLMGNMNNHEVMTSLFQSDEEED